MRRHPRIDLAVELVCSNYGLDPKDVFGRSRLKSVVEARQMAYWVCRHISRPSFSLTEIARCFDRNHTTIIQGVRAFEKDRADDVHLVVLSNRIVTVIMTPDTYRVA